LRERDLVARLGASDLGDVLPPQRYADRVKPVGRARNETEVGDYTRRLAERVAEAASLGEFVLLIGGDCSILLGALLGLRQTGRSRVGLAYVDAHSDFATLEESPSGSPCSMTLALAVGREDGTLSRLGNGAPLARCEDVVQLGSRDETQPYGHAALASMGVLDLSQRHIETEGIAKVAETALPRLSSPADGFWVHLDVDVLDPTVMPAVDSPIAGGLDVDQAVELLAPLVRHPAALGLQVTIYDPTIDPDRTGAERIVEIIERSLGADGS
jgi:arginase